MAFSFPLGLNALTFFCQNFSPIVQRVQETVVFACASPIRFPIGNELHAILLRLLCGVKVRVVHSEVVYFQDGLQTVAFAVVPEAIASRGPFAPFGLQPDAQSLWRGVGHVEVLTCCGED